MSRSVLKRLILDGYEPNKSQINQIWFKKFKLNEVIKIRVDWICIGEIDAIRTAELNESHNKMNRFEKNKGCLEITIKLFKCNNSNRNVLSKKWLGLFKKYSYSLFFKWKKIL